MSYSVAEQLKAFINRIEKLEEEKKDINDGIKDVMDQAKGSGIDIKAFKEILKLRKMDDQKRVEQEIIINLYKKAIGMEVSIDDESL